MNAAAPANAPPIANARVIVELEENSVRRELILVKVRSTAETRGQLIEIIGDERFHGVYVFVPPFVLLFYIQSIAAALGRGMDLAKKTALWPVVAVVSVLIAQSDLNHSRKLVDAEFVIERGANVAGAHA